MTPERLPIPSTTQTEKPGLPLIRYFLIVLLISVLFLGRLLWPFNSILVLSFLLTNLFRPVYDLFNRRMSEPLSSILTCLLIIALVFIPLVLFTNSLASEALNLYAWGRDTQVGLKRQTFIQKSPFIVHLQQRLQEFCINFKPKLVGNQVKMHTPSWSAGRPWWPCRQWYSWESSMAHVLSRPS